MKLFRGRGEEDRRTGRGLISWRETREGRGRGWMGWGR